ncbi:hypothetical protein TRVA0_003S04786 [Trichomonascus vanleenenianus]|uniref:uncharacterized protein n=1 Tax=Trichomonascus vanleenenianus TaxID=2268995 RepID=UPI003ECB3E06
MNSTLPFFVVGRDNSTYAIPSRTPPLADKLPSLSSTQSSLDRSKQIGDTGAFLPDQMYPEVRYVFEDDYFNPTVDVLEDENDIAVIIDFDNTGEVIQGYQSLSPTWQIVGISSAASATPSWASSEHDDQQSIKLFIDGTSSTTTTLRRRVDGSLRDTRNLMQAAVDRNEQLNRILSTNKTTQDEKEEQEEGVDKQSEYPEE